MVSLFMIAHINGNIDLWLKNKQNFFDIVMNFIQIHAASELTTPSRASVC